MHDTTMGQFTFINIFINLVISTSDSLTHVTTTREMHVNFQGYLRYFQSLVYNLELHFWGFSRRYDAIMFAKIIVNS